MRRIGAAVGRAWRAVVRSVRRILDLPVGVGREDDPLQTLYHRPMPPRLQVNWWALLLGPFWYLFTGLWTHALILFTIVLFSGGLLAPLAWLYAGLKANEDLLEARIVRHSYY
ncbi:MAG: DUF2628 domain-containing protein [Armatimonadota bacterium]|nr:DUF2628 domain-containing protein [Armatimonadota bacterium]MDR7437505.1 DUF2628 domain-containing protein [Armatimonadota bacterium]MDR7472330.1 DUF2628 domain-containing protein [Armatimonadota bacterium]MDR7506367.1 DUF2628 domain-containing protein [Armatimonadota bacterium]MDR7508418.1 DUF2628 domain-containing protein [Armatimonadota bacterium]